MMEHPRGGARARAYDTIMRLSAHAAALALLLGCSKPERAGSVGIESLIATAPAAWRDSAATLNREASDSGLRLTVWPRNDSVALDTVRFVINADHPCGPTLAARFRSMPPRDSMIAPERVVELDSAGAVVREWRVPTDEIPLGVQGDELFISYRPTVLLGLRPDGSYRVVPEVPLPSPRELACPAPQVFAQSAYERCALMTDLRSQLPRRIAYEGPCS